MEDVKQLLAKAGALHRSGALGEAEALYLRILQGKPDQFEAGHLLGMLRFQQGRLEEASTLAGDSERISWFGFLESSKIEFEDD